jgi:hypothetical protein
VTSRKPPNPSEGQPRTSGVHQVIFEMSTLR